MNASSTDLRLKVHPPQQVLEARVLAADSQVHWLVRPRCFDHQLAPLVSGDLFLAQAQKPRCIVVENVSLLLAR